MTTFTELLKATPDYNLESAIDSVLASLRGYGFAGNVVKDLYTQVTPPEVATWTGQQLQVALCRSGRETWLELRSFLPPALSGGSRAITPLRTHYNRAEFGQAIMDFAQKEA